MKNKKSKKLVKKLPNGKFQVNKAAVIAAIVRSKKQLKLADVSLIEVPETEINDVHADMSRYNADNLLNTSEE